MFSFIFICNRIYTKTSNNSIKVHYQSNKREYIVLAKASLLPNAESGSSGLVITSSGVTITRLIIASSKPLASQLSYNKIWYEVSQNTDMRDEKVFSKHRQQTRGILKELCCHVKVKPRLFILNNGRVNLLSLCKFNITKMKNSSYNPKNCLLKRIIYFQKFECTTISWNYW